MPINDSEEKALCADCLVQKITESHLYDMRIEITNRFTSDGKEFYEWDLDDGPDGIDHAHGYASDLVQAFSKILEWHERIGADYAAEVLQDMQNAQQFLTTETNNEAHD